MARHKHKRRGRRRGEASTPEEIDSDSPAPNASGTGAATFAEPTTSSRRDKRHRKPKATVQIQTPPTSPSSSPHSPGRVTKPPAHAGKKQAGHRDHRRPGHSAAAEALLQLHSSSPCATCAERPRNARLRAEMLAMLSAMRGVLETWADDVGVGDGGSVEEMEWQSEAERVVVFASPAPAEARRRPSGILKRAHFVDGMPGAETAEEAVAREQKDAELQLLQQRRAATYQHEMQTGYHQEQQHTSYHDRGSPEFPKGEELNFQSCSNGSVPHCNQTDAPHGAPFLQTLATLPNQEPMQARAINEDDGGSSSPDVFATRDTVGTVT